MKKVVLCIILCMLFLGGCFSNSHKKANASNESDYNTGYSDGYRDGYNDAFEESMSTPDYSDELRSFQSAIAVLMYDHEYDIVEKLLEYNLTGVESALELEFGSKDIEIIKNYLEELSTTVIGTCDFCGEPVYANERTILPNGIACAHHECISKNTHINEQGEIELNQ